MTVRLYMDHQVQAAITEGQRQRGVDVITVFEDNSHELDDDILLDREPEEMYNRVEYLPL